jgi:YesN/AraC family two-component response regulator
MILKENFKMEKNKISTNKMYIKSIVDVLTTTIINNKKEIEVKNRRSDALLYVKIGSCTYTFDDSHSFTVREGDVFYLADKSCYTMKLNTQSYSCIFCDFFFEFEPLRYSEAFTPTNNLLAEALFKKLLKKHSSETKESFYECLSILYEIVAMFSTLSEGEYVSGNSKKKLLDSLEFIEKNYPSKSMSVAQLAKMAGFSEVYYRKIFKAQFDIPPSEYITLTRLKKAKELILSGRCSLDECAESCGFSSLQYFCRVFKKTTGTSPGKYRKEL